MKSYIVFALLGLAVVMANDVEDEVARKAMENEGLFEGDMAGIEIDGDRKVINSDHQRWTGLRGSLLH